MKVAVIQLVCDFAELQHTDSHGAAFASGLLREDRDAVETVPPGFIISSEVRKFLNRCIAADEETQINLAKAIPQAARLGSQNNLETVVGRFLKLWKLERNDLALLVAHLHQHQTNGASFQTADVTGILEDHERAIKNVSSALKLMTKANQTTPALLKMVTPGHFDFTDEGKAHVVDLLRHDGSYE